MLQLPRVPIMSIMRISLLSLAGDQADMAAAVTILAGVVCQAVGVEGLMEAEAVASAVTMVHQVVVAAVLPEAHVVTPSAVLREARPPTRTSSFGNSY